MLSNAYFLAKFRFDTAENEPASNLQQNLANFANFGSARPSALPPLFPGKVPARARSARPAAGRDAARAPRAGASAPCSHGIRRNFMENIKI